ncbi:agmatinase [Oceanospirillaceae bacterium G-43]|uniref:Agmatinase n=2 Tax=Parathalassolituus penaei TaxID=2997323 RepID=A0A9X3EHB6_9GAMM|nr:agmatinase [Parathalassolituus penaei]MCY0967215.1 agmatinase [Parathalassolituus penaei]
MQFPVLANLADALQQSDADVVIGGVPFDMATSGRPGTRFGPQGIRQASANLVWEGARWPWDFALDDRLKVVDAGNVSFRHGEPQTLVHNLQQWVATVLAAGKSTLLFGGDHFIALPALRAIAAHHGPVALIHFDAHTDTYDNGTACDHGTMFYHAVQEGLLLPEQSIQVGIRTSYDRAGHPFEVLDAALVNDLGPQATLERIRQRVGNAPVYLTFDIDSLDPAYAPGTGTPVAGGLSTDCALKLVRGMQGLNLIGMDLVEVAPAYDHADITSLAAATLALEYLYVLAANR